MILENVISESNQTQRSHIAWLNFCEISRMGYKIGDRIWQWIICAVLAKEEQRMTSIYLVWTTGKIELPFVRWGGV